MHTTYSGPVLALHQSTDGSMYIGSGPFLKRVVDGRVTTTEQVLSGTIHGIRQFGQHTVAFGGREVWVSGFGVIETRDWVLSVTVVGDALYAAVMHNRVDKYSLSDLGAYLGTIACPVHALLYSAEIVAIGDTVQVVGGGVLSSVYFWTFGVDSNAVNEHSVVGHHKGSVFRIRMSHDFTQLLTTSDDRTVALWTRDTEQGPFIVSQSYTGHQARVWDAVWVGGGRIATACEDSLIRVFTPNSQHPKEVSGPAKDVRTLLAVGPDIVSGGDDGRVKRWHIGREKESISQWKLPISHTGRVDKDDWIRNVHLVNAGGDAVVVTAFGRVYTVNGADGAQVDVLLPDITVTASGLSGNTLYLGVVDGTVVALAEYVAVELQSVVPMRVVSIFPLAADLAVVANHCGDIALVSPTEVIFHTRIGSGKSSPRKLLSFIDVGDIWVFGDDKGYVHVVRNPLSEGRSTTSLLVSATDKIVSLQSTNSDIEVIANTSNGVSIRLDVSTDPIVVLDAHKSSHVSYLCQSDKNGLSVGFTARDFVVYDSSVQWRCECGGQRRPFDYIISTGAFLFIHATNDSLFTARGTPLCEPLMDGCNGDLVHAIVPVCSTQLVTANEDNRIRVIHADRCAVTQTVDTHEGSVRSASLVGCILITGGARSQVSLLHNREGVLEFLAQRRIGSAEDDVRVMAVAGIVDANDHHTFAIADSTGNVHLWGWPQDELIPAHTIPDISRAVCLSVTAAVDGKSFFVGASNGMVVRIDTDGVCVGSQRMHQSGVNGLACVGDYLVSVSDDQSLAVCRVDSTSFTRHGLVENASVCSIRAIAVQPSGRIVTTGTDRRVSEWALDLSSGDISFVSKTPTAVTDPLSICFLPNSDVVVGGRGIQRISL